MSGSRFDRTADSYAEAARRRNWDNLVAWCEPQPGDQVLDVAGGTGALAEALAGRVAEVTVSDISEPMLAHVAAPARAVVARAEQLPFPDHSFDLVACVRALHHVDSPTRALDEMARVVRPGGRIVIEDFLADPDPDRARRWEEIERLRDTGHRRLVAAGEVRSRLLAKGLAVDAEEQWVEDRTVASWLRLAACEGEAAKRVRELVGGPEFQIRVGRARFRRCRRRSATRRLRPAAAAVQAARTTRCSSTWCSSWASLHSRSWGEREGDVSRHCPLASASRMQYMRVWMSRLSSIVGCRHRPSAAAPDPLLGVCRLAVPQAHPSSERRGIVRPPC